MLVGQILYVVVTLFHTGGEANNHPAIFAAYAASAMWTALHGHEELRKLHARTLCFAVRRRGGAERPTPAPGRFPDGPVGADLPGTGLDGRHRGLSQSHTNAIVLAEALNAAWMTWLLVFAWRMPDSKPASSHR